MATACALTRREYQRHDPEQTVLYQVVADQLATFLESMQTYDGGLPRYVEKEFERFLACGILAHGFAHFHCDECGTGIAVAYSCKQRGFCPSCLGRRMADTAACLVDQVLPDVPVRQWVLSLPMQLRARLAHDGPLTSEVLSVFLRAVFDWYRANADEASLTAPRPGSVTFVQR